VVAAEAVRRAEAVLRDARNFLKRGTGIRNDVLRTDVLLAEMRLNQVKAGTAEGIAGAALNLAIGINVSSPTQVVDCTLEPRFNLGLADALQLAVDHREEFDVVLRSIRSARLGTGIAEAHDSLEMITTDTDKAVTAAQRAVDGARATFVLADEDFTRYQALFQDGSVSERKYQDATRIHKTARADLLTAEAKLAARLGDLARALSDQLPGGDDLEIAQLGQLDRGRRLQHRMFGGPELLAGNTRLLAIGLRLGALELTQVDLGYTRVVAPYDAVIAKKWRHLGDYARTGDPLFSMYNPDLLYTAKGLLAAYLALWGAGSGLVLGPALLTAFEGLGTEETLRTAGVFNILRSLPVFAAGATLTILLTQSTDRQFDVLRQNIRYNRPIVAESLRQADRHFTNHGSPVLLPRRAEQDEPGIAAVDVHGDSPTPR